MSLPRCFRLPLLAALALAVLACGSKKDKAKDKANRAATTDGVSKKADDDETGLDPAAPPDGVSGRLASMTVLRKSLEQVKKSYADLDRIQPREMLYKALHLVQFRIPEVLVEANKKRGEVTVMVNEKSRTFAVSNVNSPREMTTQLREVFRFIETNMNPGADVAKVEYAAINGMLSTLDPHSVLLDPETAREMDVHTRGKFGGLGIIIRMYKRRLTVVRPLAGTPAKRKGLQTGDHIAKINDEITENLTLTEAVSRMRGDPGTRVTLWIRRKGVAGLKSFNIERAIIRVESVESRKLGNNVGYIRLKQFSGRSGREVKAAMTTLQQQGVDRFILDLRWNPGGLLEQSIRIADLFLDGGDIVTTIGGGKTERRNADTGGDTTSPLVVLVNGNSASASEIVAGALRYQDRALLIGTQTFGKGSVQILYDNKDGSKLKLTVAEYLTSGDRSIQSIGITPDIALEWMFVPKQLKRARDQIRLLQPMRRHSERNLKAHLVSKYAKKAEPPAHKLRYLYAPPENKNKLGEDDDAPERDAPLDDKFVEDFEIRLARQVLEQTKHATRSGMLKELEALMARRQEDEEKKTADALKKLGIDWRDAPAGAKKSQRIVAVVRAVPGPRIKAGGTVRLVGRVTNRGKSAAYRLHLRVKADDRTFNQRELVFGYLPPGATRTFETQVKVGKAAVDRVDLLNFELHEATGAKAEIAPLKLRVVAAPKPTFAYSYQLVDDGNGDGLVQAAERHRVRVTFKNTGEGPATKTTAVLRNASGDDLRLRKARFEVGEIKPGQQKTVEFALDVAATPKASKLVIELGVSDSVSRAGLREKLRFDVQSPGGGVAAVTGAVKITATRAAVREGAAATTSTVGWASKGAVFAKTGETGDWVRIDLGSSRPGFVAKKDTTDAGSAAPKPVIEAHWQVTPPKLTIKVPTLETNRQTYTLLGRVTDETRVEDVYIYVSNWGAKIEDKKVFYKSNRANKTGPSARQLSFAHDIPLWPGSNRVTIVARENRNVLTSQTIVIYKR